MTDKHVPDRAPALDLSRRRFLAGTGGVAMLTIFPGLLAACGSEESTGGASADAKIGGKLNWMGFEGEDAKTEAEAWRKSNGVDLNAKYMSAQDDLLNALTIGTPLDLIAPFNGFIAVLEAAGQLQAFDESLVPNFDDVFPRLQEADFLRGADGSLLAVPVIWGDGPYVFRPDAVPADPPSSVMGLADKAWKDEVIWLDDPYNTFVGFARALGFSNPTELTQEQLDQCVEAAKPVMKNVVNVAASFGDATDMLVRGDASISAFGWRVMVPEGAKKGVTLEAGLFTDLGTAFCDCYAIPKASKNVATAHAYANEALAPKTNAALATALQSGAVTTAAFDALDKDAQTLYDYGLVETADSPLEIINILPPQEPEDGIMGATDWQDAWNSLKS